MNWTVWLLLLAGLAALRFLKPKILVWVAAWWLFCFLGLTFGFETPIPSSVFKLYMALATGALLAYVFADRERQEEFKKPLVAFLTERRFLVPLAVVALLIPAAVAFSIYLDMTTAPAPPSFGRTVHPAPPDAITVHEKEISLVKGDNPYRQLEETDPEAFRQHVEAGREVYYRNCFYCHGDLMQGEGMFAHGLNPIPTNFQDAGTIAQLQESFLFWRIAKGGPGLPDEGGPWDSAMPAWENFLTEEEMWDVVLFLYEFTGYRPRARETHE